MDLGRAGAPGLIFSGFNVATPTKGAGRVSLTERLEALKARHAGLEAQIAEENKRPHPDDTVIHALKKEKLRVKDEIARIERNPAH
jgi:hypothetical protein